MKREIQCFSRPAERHGFQATNANYKEKTNRFQPECIEYPTIALV